MNDEVTHPSHYNTKVPGIECIDVAQHFTFNAGNVIKYVWRAGEKGDAVKDLLKAREYLDFEIARLRAQAVPAEVPVATSFTVNQTGISYAERRR